MFPWNKTSKERNTNQIPKSSISALPTYLPTHPSTSRTRPPWYYPRSIVLANLSVSHKHLFCASTSTLKLLRYFSMVLCNVSSLYVVYCRPLQNLGRAIGQCPPVSPNLQIYKKKLGVWFLVIFLQIFCRHHTKLGG